MSQQVIRRGFRFSPTCSACGQPRAAYEVLAPGELPALFDQWEDYAREIHLRYTDEALWRVLVESPGGSNGLTGDPVQLDAERAAELHRKLQAADPTALREAADDSLGFCEPCAKFYCYWHWNPSNSQHGTCPAGHRQGIDPARALDVASW